MFRIPAAVAAVIGLGLCLGFGCQAPGPSAASHPRDRPSPSIAAHPPRQVRLHPPQEAILTDAAVGLPRRAGVDHLTEAEAVSQQPDQVAALAEFATWEWLQGASRTWSIADETLVLTARDEGAVRAFNYWSRQAGQAPFASGACSPQAAAGLDDCALAVAGDRAIVVGRLGPAVFRISCPASVAERLTAAQAAALDA